MDVDLSHAGENERSSSMATPPWLWCWLLIYLFGLPQLIVYYSPTFTYLFTGTIPGVQNAATGDSPIFARLVGLAELVPVLAVFFGVLMIAFPWLRTWYLTKRHNITELTISSGAYGAIRAFVREQDANVQLKQTGLTTREFAFVYPLGYRKTALALGPRIVKLWREDQQAAEAILLHEIAHHRHGDTLIVGEGSFFEWVVRYWLYLYLVFTFIPEVILLISPLSSPSLSDLLGPQFSTELSSRLEMNVVPYLPVLVLFFLSIAFQAFAVFILPLLGIWCAEFDADRYVVQVKQSPQALLHALQSGAYRSSWWGWLASRTHHPPNHVRRWMARWSTSGFVFLALLLLFPLAYIVRFLALLGTSISTRLSFEVLRGAITVSDTLQGFSDNIQVYFSGVAHWWLAMAIVLVLWPILAHFWQRFFIKEQSIPGSRRYVPGYLIAAIILIGLSLSSYVLPGLTTPMSSTLSGVRSSTSTASSLASPKIGEAVTAGNLWMVTINNVRTHSNTRASQAQPGDVYVVIDITLKNISSKDQLCVPSLQMRFENLQKVRYDDAFTGFATPPIGTVAPGKTIHGQLVYQAPLSIHHFTFSFQPDSDTTLATWHIDI